MKKPMNDKQKATLGKVLHYIRRYWVILGLQEHFISQS